VIKTGQIQASCDDDDDDNDKYLTSSFHEITTGGRSANSTVVDLQQ